jgi:uncharacterized protein
MKRKIILPTLLLSLLVGLAACGANNNEAKISAVQNTGVPSANETVAPSQSPSEKPTQVSPSQAVTASAAEINLRADDAAEAVIKIIVADGYHINGNPASEDYLRPTELKIESAAKITVGKPIYPKAEMKKFDFNDKPISVYEGTVIVKLPIRVGKTAAIGRTVLRGTIQAQPCNDNACFPSRTVEIVLPVQVTQ